MTDRRTLLELAHWYGVLPSYVDGGGMEWSASPETLVAVLRALDAPLHRREDARAALRQVRAERESRLLPPVTVAWEGEEVTVPLRLSQDAATRGVECRLRTEEGSVWEWRWKARPTSRRRPSQRSARFPWVPLGTPEHLLFVANPVGRGIHELRVRASGREARTWIVRAPRTTWDPGAQDGQTGARSDGAARGPRDVGLFLPLHALRTGRSWGTGDLTDLRMLLEWSQDRGVGFVGTLPLMSAFLKPQGGPFDPAPYAPVSRLFWNELYLDVEAAVAEHGGFNSAAKALLRSSALRDEVALLREAPRVRYADAMSVKRQVLEALVSDVAPIAQPISDELAEYAAKRPDAVDYAHFRAVCERLAKPWRDWPSPLRDGHLGGSIADGSSARDPQDEAAFRYHLYAQHLFESQLAALSLSAALAGHTSAFAPRARPSAGLPALYLDLPLGAHPDGYDVWRYRNAFARELSGGAPPDTFFAGGQDWGFPPLHPERTREDAHAYTRRSLAHLMQSAGMIRLDHVMSLNRLYCVPADHEARDGAYVTYPAEELYAVLCLESHRWQCKVVGEDLGTVPQEVREAMKRHRLRRMYVLPFELATSEDAQDGRSPPAASFRVPPSLSVASLGTHDLPPFAAFWSGLDIERRQAVGLLRKDDAERERKERTRWWMALADALFKKDSSQPVTFLEASDALRAALHSLAASPAEHLLVSVEDLWQETESQNTPGTSGDKNWTHKALHPLESWSYVPDLERTVAALVAARQQSAAEPEGAWAK